MTYFLHNINSKIKHITWYCSSDIFYFDEGLKNYFKQEWTQWYRCWCLLIIMNKKDASSFYHVYS